MNVEGVWMMCVFVMCNVRQINNDDDAAVIYIEQAVRNGIGQNQKQFFFISEMRKVFHNEACCGNQTEGYWDKYKWIKSLLE